MTLRQRNLKRDVLAAEGGILPQPLGEFFLQLWVGEIKRAAWLDDRRGRGFRVADDEQVATDLHAALRCLRAYGAGHSFQRRAWREKSLKTLRA